MQFKTWLGHTFFNLGYWTFFWGAFELAYQSPSHPIWSGTFGFPVPHHYIVGALIAYIGYVLVTFNETLREGISSRVRVARPVLMWCDSDLLARYSLSPMVKTNIKKAASGILAPKRIYVIGGTSNTSGD